MEISSFFANMKPYQLILIIALIQSILGLIIWKSKYRNYIGQILVPTTILTLALIFYVITYQFPNMSGLSSGTTAATVPRLWIVLILLSFIVYIIGIVRGREKEDPALGRIDIVGIVTLQLIVSVILFEYIGYYISSVLFLVTCMYLLEYRKIKVMAIISVSWVVFTYFIFYRIL